MGTQRWCGCRQNRENEHWDFCNVKEDLTQRKDKKSKAESGCLSPPPH